MTFLGLDVGTTRCKALLCDVEGETIRLESRPTPLGRDPEGRPQYDPEELWQTVASAASTAARRTRVAAVGVASMAESGLLVDRRTGVPRTPIIPWFDTRAVKQAESMGSTEDPPALFGRAGLRPSFKCGLAKLLWLTERDPAIADGAVWLSVADYIVFRLTGELVTDPTLAARTYAFSIESGTWDRAWLNRFGLSAAMFPAVLPSGAPAGTVPADGAGCLLPSGTPVAVAGHDHLCALLPAGVLEPGPVLDSLGTAESMIGVLDRLDLGPHMARSGLAVVPHVLPGTFCWLGGLSAAGGSVEWLRSALGDMSYEDIGAGARVAGKGPTRILYLPYLHGSGAPHPDSRVRAMFAGIGGNHRREHLMRAVLEGISYEAESIRRTAVQVTGRDIEELIVVGGGARNEEWIRIKATVSACRCVVPALDEAVALGAALAAAHGTGAVPSIADLARIARRFREKARTVEPDVDTVEAYRAIYEKEYCGLQEPARLLGHTQMERNVAERPPIP